MSKVPDSKPAAKPDSTAGKKADDAAGPKSDLEADRKAGGKTDAKPVSAAEAKPDAATADKPVEKPTGKPADKPAEKPTGKPAEKAGEKPAAKPSPKASSGRGFLRGFGIAAVVLVAAAIGGAATLKDWWPRVEPYVGEWVEPFLPEAGGDDEGERRLAAIEERLDAVESTANAAPNASAIADLEAARAELSQQIGDILNRLAAAERAVSSLKSTAAALAAGGGSGSAGSGAESALAERLSEIESLSEDLAASRSASQQVLQDLSRQVEALAAARAGASAAAVQSQALVLGVGQIRRAMTAGRPFDEPLSALAATAAGDPAIEQAIARMQPHAATGVATLQDLRRTFSVTAGSIVQAGRALEETDWIATALNKISGLVSVRRVDGQGDPDSVDDIVAAAEDALAAGNVSDAVEIVGSLQGAAADAASGWLAGAAARRDVAAALDELQDMAIRRLQAAAGGQG